MSFKVDELIEFRKRQGVRVSGIAKKTISSSTFQQFIYINKHK